MAAVRALAHAGRNVRLIGVAGYNSAKGGDKLFQELQALRPGVVLMESFAAEGAEVSPGGAVPYRELLPARGLAIAQERVAEADFRSACTAETVAVLAALRLGAEVRLGDRLHVASFDRLVRRFSLDALRGTLTTAVEAAAAELRGHAGTGPTRVLDLPQNFFCPFFPELGAERHALMAHFARRASQRGADVAVVVGAEHVDPVAACIEAVEEAPSAEDLLREPPDEPVEEGGAAWQQELEKRLALAAFLASTSSWPPETVLPPLDGLLPAAQAFAKEKYPQYRNAFMGRLMEALRPGSGDREHAARALQAASEPRASGLPQLAELCARLAEASDEHPPTPPPPPSRQ